MGTDTKVFSTICVPGSCEARLLEPLAWSMKDPRNDCLGFEDTRKEMERVSDETNTLPQLSKAYLALPSDPAMVRGRRVLLYDLGASLYGNGCTWGLECKSLGKKEGWGTSGSWFVENFGKKGIRFDHLFLWEKRFTEEQYRAAGLPFDLKDKITFYHGAINPDDMGNLNPLKVLKETCAKEDYCILKVDFDSEDAEDKIKDRVVDNVGASLIASGDSRAT